VRYFLGFGFGLGFWGFWGVGGVGVLRGWGLGSYDPFNPLHGGVSALDAAGVAGGGW
jgi:hypothetical protein